MSPNIYNHFRLRSRVIGHSLRVILKVVDEFLFCCRCDRASEVLHFMLKSLVIRLSCPH